MKRLNHTETGPPLVGAPDGFVTKMLTCLQCNDRVPLDSIKREHLQRWVLEHAPHINVAEPWKTVRTLWREW
jgi:hypothetical protein